MLEVPNFQKPPFVDDRKMEQLVDDPAFQRRVRNRVIEVVYSVENKARFDVEQTERLLEKFFQEIHRQFDWVKKIASSEFVGLFGKAAQPLLEYLPDRISVEITSAHSIFLFTQIEAQKIYFEIFFDVQSGRHTKAVLNVFEQKNQKLADSGSVSDLLDALHNYLNPAAEIRIIYPARTTYGVSRNSYSTTYIQKNRGGTEQALALPDYFRQGDPQRGGRIGNPA